MTPPAQSTTRSLYAPLPFADYCPEDKPEMTGLWHAVPGGVDNDVGAARWNLLWLTNPVLDRVIHLPREYGPEWRSLKLDLTLAALVAPWAELRHAALCEPSVLKIWLHRNRDHIFMCNTDDIMPTVLQRLDDAISRLGPRSVEVPPRPTIDRIAGNVVFIRFPAASRR